MHRSFRSRIQLIDLWVTSSVEMLVVYLCVSGMVQLKVNSILIFWEPVKLFFYFTPSQYCMRVPTPSPHWHLILFSSWPSSWRWGLEMRMLMMSSIFSRAAWVGEESPLVNASWHHGGTDWSRNKLSWWLSYLLHCNSLVCHWHLLV